MNLFFKHDKEAFLTHRHLVLWTLNPRVFLIAELTLDHYLFIC
jgi:hypothetical protein